MPDPVDNRAEEAMARFARLRPRWHPPPNQIPGVLPIGAVLGRSDTVVAVLLEVHAYPVGLEFRLTYRGRGRGAHDHPPFSPTRPELAERIGLPVASSPQVTVTLSDGTSAVTLERASAFARLDDLADHPVLIEGGGGGSNEHLDVHFWLTPNPATAVQLHFGWPEQQHAASSVSIGAAQLAAATAAAVTLWPWDPTDVMR